MNPAALALLMMLHTPSCEVLERLPSTPPKTQNQAPSLPVIEESMLIPFPDKQTIVHMNQTQGEAQLRRLSLLGIVEELWVYVPRTEIWHDVGYDNETYAVMPDAKKIFALLRSEPGARVYHHHTATVRDGVPYTYFEQALPSGNDLTKSIAVGVYANRYFPEEISTNVIVSPLGITEVELTPLGVKCFSNNVGKIQSYATSIESSLGAVKSIEEGLQKVNTPLISVTFTPFEK